MRDDDKRHGTYAGVVAHARAGIPECPRCVEARRRSQARWSNLRKLGYKHYLSAEPVRRHVEELLAGGMTYTAIAERAGVSVTTVEDAGREQSEVHRVTAEAILGVPLTPHPEGQIDATGTRRRLQALATLGWSQNAIVAESVHTGTPLTLSVVRYIMAGTSPTVRVRTRDAVASLYERCSMIRPAPSRAVSMARAIARREGYLPPLAWNDIDDPNEQPEGWQYQPRKTRNQHADELDPVVVQRLLEGDKIPSTAAEKAEAIAVWVANGGSINEFCRIHGWNDSRYTTLRVIQGGAA